MSEKLKFSGRLKIVERGPRGSFGFAKGDVSSLNQMLRELYKAPGRHFNNHMLLPLMLSEHFVASDTICATVVVALFRPRLRLSVLADLGIPVTANLEGCLSRPDKMVTPAQIGRAHV